MALPKIAPYSYREQEHQNRVNWRVDPVRAALLVHDMQRYFVRAFELERNGQPLPDAQINIAIANIRRLLDAAHAANIPVYYTAQPPRQNPADRRLLTDFWGDGLQDDENARILDELAPHRSRYRAHQMALLCLRAFPVRRAAQRPRARSAHHRRRIRTYRLPDHRP